MSLRSKIILIVTLVVCAYAGLDHAIQRGTVSPSFEALERDEARQDLARIVGALDNEIEHLDTRCRDWATWDDTWRFVEDGNPGYIESNLGQQALAAGNIDLLYICAPDGRVAWGRIHDLEHDRELSLRELPRESLVQSHPFLVETDAPRGAVIDERKGERAMRGYISGLVVTEVGPLLLSCRPILTSTGEGPVRGTVIMGRLLSDALVARVAERTAVDFDRWILEQEGPGAHDQDLVDQLTATTDPVLRAHDDETLWVYGTFPDLDRRPALMLRANVARDISARGADSVRYALVSTIGSGLLLLLVLLGVIQRMVLTPIEKLTTHAVEIGATDDSDARIQLQREDEIGVLANEFDRMMEKLAVSRAAVVKTARSAGMSEIATGILHNVGNVLNSVNVSATLVSDRVKASKLAKLKRLADMVEKQGDELGSFISNNPKGKHVGPYLGEVTRMMEVEHSGIVEELEVLSTGIEHIRSLVHSQQSFAGQNELRERIDLERQIDMALDLSNQVHGEGTRVQIVREIDELPRIFVDRHKLAEILVNLISNARQATEAGATTAPRIVLRARLVDDGDRVRIEVSDNGIGIPEENIARVFNHGFTTKPTGHGFGLHAAANAATEMRGSLSLHSDGHEKGATFVLEIPLEPASQTH